MHMRGKRISGVCLAGATSLDYRCREPVWAVGANSSEVARRCRRRRPRLKACLERCLGEGEHAEMQESSLTTQCMARWNMSDDCGLETETQQPMIQDARVAFRRPVALHACTPLYCVIAIQLLQSPHL